MGALCGWTERLDNAFHPARFENVWRNSEVRPLAQSADEERDLPLCQFSALWLHICADAVEEADCIDPYFHGHGCARSVRTAVAVGGWTSRLDPAEVRMTEEEWLGCHDPRIMLGFLREQASDRKLRLFASACCRRLWPRLADEDCPRALEVAERYADGLSTSSELEQAWMASAYAADHGAEGAAESAICGATEDDAWGAAHVASTSAARASADSDGERAVQRLLLHCIFGNPFRVVPLRRACLTTTAISVAQQVYDKRFLPSGELDTGHLAVLSDILEEAGCTDADLLSHLRSPGPHVRGCWPVDLLLGKQ